MARAKPKNYALEPAFLDELQAARRHYIEQEPRVWDALNGNLSEGVFIQMAARLGMEMMRQSPEALKSMWEHLPSTARGYDGT